MFESRSPDGDGLITRSVVTTAESAPCAGAQETVPRPNLATHGRGEARKEYREQNAAAGSEPADSHSDSRSTLEAKLAAAEQQLDQHIRHEFEPCQWFYLTESQVEKLAKGDVTHELQLMFAYALDVFGELERNAARPPARKRTRATSPTLDAIDPVAAAQG